jgi:SAM-dependent methyltransferase
MDNCFFHSNGVDEKSLPDASQDFGVSLGVLHHVPDTAAGIKSCAQMLKPGAPFLLYLYYALDNRPFWFRVLWKLSDVVRIITSKLPHTPRYIVSQIIALFVYWPLARASRLLERAGLPDSLVSLVPLSTYRSLSFYTIRTDSLDRFGTRLEQRFTKSQIFEMMSIAGFENITFSNSEPYWVAVGYKK